jgi:aspartate/methionine/tyrosine aminotransferase
MVAALFLMAEDFGFAAQHLKQTSREQFHPTQQAVRLMRGQCCKTGHHGSAVDGMVQAASVAAWNDEAHVVENRAKYRAKFAAVTPILSTVMDVRLPDAAFYLWAAVPGGDDIGFARALLAQYNVTVLPGSLLAREAHGVNPGRGHISQRW